MTSLALIRRSQHPIHFPHRKKLALGSLVSAGKACTIPTVMAPNSSSAPSPSGLCQWFARQFAHAPTHEIRRQILCQRE